MKDTCPGCGESFPANRGATHEYIGASAGCWDTYTQVLARDYSDGDYFKVHGLLVDAYSVQHPGIPGRKSVQSVCVHLIALYFWTVQGVDVPLLVEARRKAVLCSNMFEWLEPPTGPYNLTVKSVMSARNAEEHNSIVKSYAHDVWRKWHCHHDTVSAWAKAIST